MRKKISILPQGRVARIGPSGRFDRSTCRRKLLVYVCACAGILFPSSSCQPAPNSPGARQTDSRDMTQNPSFEDWTDGAPGGWVFEERVRHKGVVSAARKRTKTGSIALRLAPNEKNDQKLEPLAVGQAFPIGPYRGKNLQLSAWLGAEGEAVAAAGVYVVRKDGKITASVELRVGKAGGPALTHKQGMLKVPADDSAVFLILRCAVEGTGGSAYFDDVALREEASDVPPTGAKPGRPLAARVTVHADRAVRPIPKSLFGTNVEWVHDGNGLWDAKRGRLNAELVRLTRELGATCIRFPGGVFSDFYDWRMGTGPRPLRKSSPQHAEGPKSRHSFGTDEALEFAKRVGGELLITVNAGTGTPADAAAWIRYVNHQQHPKLGTPKVTYWEVGNELYIKDDSPATKAVAIPPGKYAQRFLAFAKAMRKADPSIKIGAIGGENYGRYVQNSFPGWNRQVLKAAGKEIDFLAVHNAYAPLALDGRVDIRTVYAAMLAAPVLIKRNLETVSAQIKTFAPARASKIKIAVTEWGPLFHVLPSSRYVDHVKTLGSALFVASTMKAFIESPAVEVANAFKLVEPTFMGWIGPRRGRYIPKPPYLALQMYARHFGTVLVRSSSASPTYDSIATGFVDAVRGVPYLDVVASRSADGKTLYVLAVNKHFDRAIAASIDLRGFKPAGRATAWLLHGPSIDSNTGTELLKVPGLTWAEQARDKANPRFHKGSPDEVRITSSRVDIPAATFQYTFPAHSVTSLEIAAAP